MDVVLHRTAILLCSHTSNGSISSRHLYIEGLGMLFLQTALRIFGAILTFQRLSAASPLVRIGDITIMPRPPEQRRMITEQATRIAHIWMANIHHNWMIKEPIILQGDIQPFRDDWFQLSTSMYMKSSPLPALISYTTQTVAWVCLLALESNLIDYRESTSRWTIPSTYLLQDARSRTKRFGNMELHQRWVHVNESLWNIDSTDTSISTLRRTRHRRSINNTSHHLQVTGNNALVDVVLDISFSGTQAIHSQKTAIYLVTDFLRSQVWPHWADSPVSDDVSEGSDYTSATATSAINFPMELQIRYLHTIVGGLRVEWSWISEVMRQLLVRSTIQNLWRMFVATATVQGQSTAFLEITLSKAQEALPEAATEETL